MTITLTKPIVGGSEDSWGTTINTALDDVANALNGVTATTPDLTAGSWKVGGTAVTSTAAELNLLDGVTATTVELNYVDGVTSNIQAQLDAKAPLASPTFTGTATIPTIDFGNWTITESGGSLYFATGGTNMMKLDASGNLDVVGNVNTGATIT